MQRYPGWHEFENMPIGERFPFFEKEGCLFDVLYAEQFSRRNIEKLCSLANRIRAIASDKKGLDFLRSLLSDKRAMLFFVQPSTRTFLSFLNACQILGIQTSEIRDATTSSEVKGESEEDTIRTFSSYVDLIITRHMDEGFAQKAAWVLNQHSGRSVPVISGGSGKDQHPTQALLDIYTLERSFAKLGGIDGKRIAMIGDLKRGRTARSLCRLLTLYKDVTFHFVAPKSFQMRDDILDVLQEHGQAYHFHDTLDSIISQADAFYCTRLQDEYDEVQGESSKAGYQSFNLTPDNVCKMKKDAVIMHPFPRRNEIDVRVDLDPRASYWKQGRNGMWIRAALILTLFGREGMIN